MEIVRKKISRRQLPKGLMRLLIVYLWKRMRILRSTINPQRNNRSSSDTPTKVPSEKTPRKQPRKKRTKRRGSSLPRDLSRPKRRRSISPP
jgi:hypothetical protein